ncbi:MAG: type II toxin-antitoxin system HicA family toxin [Burkholderiales bacterium]
MNGKDIIQKLKANGWQVLRQEGSHVRLGKDSARTTVPLHGARDVKIGTLLSIERQTGVKLRK